MSEIATTQRRPFDLAWKAAAVIVLRVLALAACAIVLARLLPSDQSTVDTDGLVPLWTSVGLVIGLFTVVLAAWRPVQDQWVICLVELAIAAAAIAAAWVVGDESEAVSQPVPLLASVWLAFAAVDLARTVRHT